MEIKTITSTAETLNRLKNFKTEISLKEGREVLSFNVEDIDISKEKMYVNGEILSESSVKRVLSHLRVKNNFLALSDSMNSTDWDTVKEVLKKPTASQIVYGRRTSNGDENVIDDIYMAAPKSSGLIDTDVIFNEVIDTIISTGKDITLKSARYLSDKDEIVVTLVENDNIFDIFGDETELWKFGKRITWNETSFSIFDYYERTNCGSGVVIPKSGFKCNVSNNKFNIDKIRKVLETEITLNSEDENFNIIHEFLHLNNINVSVREFFRYKNFFIEALHSDIIEKWFSEDNMNKAYGNIVDKMSDLWKITADSGENAFEFFKKMIYIASHSDEARKKTEVEEAIDSYKEDNNIEKEEDAIIPMLTEREMYDLEIKASELLLKKELDLETIAPKVKWK